MSNNMFIVAKYLQTLRNPHDANKQDIGKKHSAWQNNEEVYCRRNLKPRDLAEAAVIIDVRNQKVLKNRFGDNHDFAELYKYYLTHYADYINHWVNEQRARRPSA
jgi:hypothetical protein